jgi:hypothetical protein
MMRHAMVYPFVFLLSLSVVSAAAVADVYRWTGDDGTVIFSDTPQAGAELIELNETTVVPAQEARRRTERRSPSQAQQNYASLVIINPANEATFRNVSAITVSVALNPVLQVDAGHKLQVYLDGAAYGSSSTSSQIALADVVRGSHQVAVAVLDEGGREMLRSATSQFFVHQRSILH